MPFIFLPFCFEELSSGYFNRGRILYWLPAPYNFQF